MLPLKYIGYLLFLCTILVGCQPDETKELKLIGHRGAMGLLPENIIPGFKKLLNWELTGSSWM